MKSVLVLVILCAQLISGHPSMRSTNSKNANISGFEEVYKWKEITFTPLDNGMHMHHICW